MNGTGLLVSDARLTEMGEEQPGLRNLWEAPVVFVSSVTSVKIDRGEADYARHRAAVQTALTSSHNGVPHLFMVGDTSHPDVAAELKDAGALVLMVRPNEVGLARPYLTAARLVDRYAGSETLMVKAEGDKNLATPSNVKELLDAARHHSVITGIRSAATWRSMPEYQTITESVLAATIAEIAHVPFDTPSGIIALGYDGRHLLRQTVNNDWGYLIEVPAVARHQGVGVTGVEVDFRYPAEMVESERNAPQDDKRRKQFQLMIDRAVLLAGSEVNLTRRERQLYYSCLYMLDGLERLAARPS